ncbi:MAG: PAS domain S-box protein [Methanoregula sp.]|nr:PAS domain S-box protein [Methanoregula sp.]
MISVLYVDDEPDLLELAQIFLEQSGEFRVTTSTSAQGALDLPSILSFDAIVSDYQMPGMDGIAFLKAIRKLSETLPFILFTGRGREEVVIEAINNGADFYLQKGGEPRAQFAELSNKIRYSVSRKRMEKELQTKNDELNASYEQIAANEEELRQQLDELTVKQEALKNSEERFRAFTENIPDLTTIVDKTGVYTYVSPSIQRITGRGADELLGKKFAEFEAVFGILPEDKEILLQGGRIAMQEPGKTLPVPPFRIRTINGETLFIEGTNTFLPEVKGIQGLIFHGRDISDRIRAEEELRRKNDELNASYEQITASDEELRGQYEELEQSGKRIRESEGKFRSFFEKTHDALLLFTGDTVIDCNQPAVDLFGYPSKDDLIGLQAAVFSPPQQSDGKDSQVAAAAHLGTVFEKGVDHYEWLHKRKDGSTFPSDILLSAFELEGKQVFLSSVRDVTKRKQAERERQNIIAFLNAIVEQNPSPTWISDERGFLIRMNPACMRMLHSTEEEFAGKYNIFDDNIVEEQGYMPLVRSVFEEGKVVTFPLTWDSSLLDTVTVRDRVNLNLEVTIFPIKDATGKLTNAVIIHNDISERVRAGRVLAESEERYRTLVNSSFDGIAIHQDGVLVYVNQTATRLLGADDPAYFIGKPALDIVHPDDRPEITERIRQSTEKPMELLHERFRRANGDYMDVDVATSPCTWQGRPAVYVTFRDISERKRAEEALYNSQQMLQIVLDTIPQRVFWKDKNSVFLGCNKPNALDAGFADPADMVGKTDYDYTSAGIADLYRADDRHVMETGQARVNYEEPQERSDGSTAWLRTSKVPLHDKAGQVIGVLGTYEDITEQKRNEAALRESEEKYRTLVEKAKEAIAIVQDRNIVFVNKSGADILGIPAGELEGKPFIDYIWPDDREMITVRHSGREAGDVVPDAYDFRIIGAGGRPVWVLISSASISWQGRPATLSLMTDITERKFAEGALQDSEEMFRKVSEGAPEAIYIGADWKFVYLNPAALRLLGASSGEQLIGTPFLNRIHPRFHDVIKNRVHHLYDDKTAAPPLEEVYIRLDGTEIDVEVSSVPFSYQGKNGALVFVWNISKRKKAERERRESEEKYKRIFESLVDIYYETDKDGIVRVISPSVFLLSGWKPEDLIGKTILNLYQNPRDRLVLIERLNQSPIVSGFEVLLKKRDGTPTAVSVNARIRYSASGEPDGIMGSIRDVAEISRARKALQESEETHRRILENMQDAYLRADMAGNLTMANLSAARMYGYDSPDEMIGMPAAALYHNPEQRREMLRQLQEHGRLSDFSGTSQKKDGTAFWTSLSVQFIVGDDGSINGTEGIVRDMTERKLLELAIQEANKKLNLLNNITRHDVVNQLTALRGYAQLVEMKDDDPVVADFMHKIEEATDTISRQLEFTRTYQELGVHTPSWYRLEEMVEKAGRPEVTFSRTCQKVEVFADPMLERVFYNIFENAVRHGGHVTEIAVRCEREPDGLVIIIEDNGVGVVPEEKEKIFEKGFGRNTGYGLFLSREILAITGITIRETGYAGVGARFEITVPKEMYRFTAGQ